MNTFKKIYGYLVNPLKLFLCLDRKGIIKIPDKAFIKLEYEEYMKEKLDLRNVKTFNEKLQWLKLYDRKPEYTNMVDKYEAKKYVANLIGEEYIIPTLGIYDTFDEIDFEKLPDQFVIKCTHDSGGLVICRDKQKIDIEKAKEKINNCLKRNYYREHREWPYKNVKPRIIVEQYIEDANDKLRDYKLFCFNGVTKVVYVSEGLEDHSTARISFLDSNFKKTSISRKDFKEFEQIPPKPLNFEKMKKLSAILAKDIPHVRVDWYEINGKLYFGELTFYTGAGFIPFSDYESDLCLGEMINI